MNSLRILKNETSTQSTLIQEESGRSMMVESEEVSNLDLKSQMFQVKKSIVKFKHYPLLLYTSTCTLILCVLIYIGLFRTSVNNDTKVSNLSCRSWGYWPGSNCGLNGINCMPFESQQGTAIRCGKGCTWDQDETLKVIGSGPYKADSRICKSAIHSGVISKNGGCAIMKLTGAQLSYEASENNSIKSVSFDSWFPKSFTFYEPTNVSGCKDLSLITFLFLFVFLFGFVCFKDAPPLLMLMILNCWSYWYVAFFADPRSLDYTEVFVTGLSEIFVVLCATYAFYFMAPRYTFMKWSFYTIKDRLIFWAICYITPYMITLHLNYFAYLPSMNIGLGGAPRENTQFSTLSVIAYVVLGIILLLIISWHLICLKRIGKLVQYLLAYICCFTLALFIYFILPGYGLHIHHAMLGVIILPITRFTNKLSAITQALALGLIIQGYTRWGWSPFVERTPVRFTLPVLDAPEVLNITFTDANVTWIVPSNLSSTIQGYSLWLNGVEKYRGNDTSYVIENLISNMTYYLSVSVIGFHGSEGLPSEISNFTTLLD